MQVSLFAARFAVFGGADALAAFVVGLGFLAAQVGVQLIQLVRPVRVTIQLVGEAAQAGGGGAESPVVGVNLRQRQAVTDAVMDGHVIVLLSGPTPLLIETLHV